MNFYNSRTISLFAFLCFFQTGCAAVHEDEILAPPATNTLDSGAGVPRLVFSDVAIVSENISFDFGEKSFQRSDFGAEIKFCSTPAHFCVESPFLFSVPFDFGNSEAASWSIAGNRFSLAQSTKISPCRGSGVKLFQIYAYNESTKLRTSYIYTAEFGIQIMNEYEDPQLSLEPKYSWVNCNSEVLSMRQIRGISE